MYVYGNVQDHKQGYNFGGSNSHRAWTVGTDVVVILPSISDHPGTLGTKKNDKEFVVQIMQYTDDCVYIS